MRSMIDSTDAFEAWMRKRTDVSRKLLKKKHRRMCEGPFPFLRATFYRWIEQWPRVCPRLADRDEDVLLAVGDLHVENFGVWRDSRQRLVWGVNDFDDACELPFTSDLVRLATSAMLAASDARVNVSAPEVCALLIEGYRSGLKLEGQPILVASGKIALVRLTKGTQEDPQTFWKKKLDPKKNPPIDGRDLPKRPRGHVRRLVPVWRASDIPGAEIARRPGQPRPQALHRRHRPEQRRPRRTRSQGARAICALLADGTDSHAVADRDASSARDP